MDAIGEPNHFSLHQGMPVTAGTKYIITKWYRERPWGYVPVTRPTERACQRRVRRHRAATQLTPSEGPP